MCLTRFWTFNIWAFQPVHSVTNVSRSAFVLYFFSRLHDMISPILESLCCRIFIQVGLYFRNFWLQTIPPVYWTKFDNRDHRTTNIAEGYHNKLSKVFFFLPPLRSALLCGT